MLKFLGRPGGLLAIFGLLSLATVATGVFVTATHGAPASAWMGNLAAWAVGGVVALGLARFLRPSWVQLFLWAAPVGIALTFLGAEQEGVHRWLDLGVVHVNMAMLLLPAAIVSLSFLAFEQRRPWIAVAIALALLALQPDASQATTLAVVAALVALAAVRPAALRFGLVLGAAALAALAWSRPDPLEPVPEVEGVLALAMDQSPWLGVLATLLLACIAAAPLLVTFSSQNRLRIASIALGLTFLLWALLPAVGAFPTPLLGLTMSPILGAWLGVGLLAGALRTDIHTRLN